MHLASQATTPRCLGSCIYTPWASSRSSISIGRGSRIKLRKENSRGQRVEERRVTRRCLGELIRWRNRLSCCMRRLRRRRRCCKGNWSGSSSIISTAASIKKISITRSSTADTTLGMIIKWKKSIIRSPWKYLRKRSKCLELWMVFQA